MAPHIAMKIFWVHLYKIRSLAIPADLDGRNCINILGAFQLNRNSFKHYLSGIFSRSPDLPLLRPVPASYAQVYTFVQLSKAPPVQGLEDSSGSFSVHHYVIIPFSYVTLASCFLSTAWRQIHIGSKKHNSYRARFHSRDDRFQECTQHIPKLKITSKKGEVNGVAHSLSLSMTRLELGSRARAMLTQVVG